jgi:hypothetical protein
MAFTAEELELLQNVSESLKYVPVVYKEVILSANTDTSHHYIKHKIGQLDFNSLLFFLPLSYDSSQTDTQFIKLLQPGEGFTIDSVNIKTYKVLYEKTLPNGSTSFVEAKRQHLRSLRLYILRMISDNEVVIVNYQETDVVNFTANAEFVNATFTTMPTIIVDEEEYTFVKSNEFLELKDRVSALERKIIVNTQAPEEALAQEDEGTIYVKVEEYGSTEG